MFCPNCNRKMQVMESKTQDNVTYRRYRCECGVYFHTQEKYDESARNKLTKIRYEKKI